MPNSDQPRPAGIVAFVFTDLEDSTRLWEADAEAMRADAARTTELIDAAVGRHDGVRAVEQGAGDSAVAAFSRASDALLAAIDIQTAMHREAWTSAQPLLLRVAVHAGEVEVDNAGTYSGPTMNRCGRLLQAAHGGQLVASASTFELGRSGLGAEVTVVDLGSHHLRGIDDPMAVVQVGSPLLSSVFPPLRTIEGGAAQVPRPDSTFIGRDRDLVMLADLLDGHRVVTIVGAGGCGKTRLAIEAVRRQIERIPDGVFWIDLAAAASPEAVLDAAATSLDVRSATAPSVEQITAQLATRSALVVIDNAEHLLGAVADLAGAIEARCPSTRVLATSREPLGLKDEAVWRVPSLALPAAYGHDLFDVDAGRLLVDRIRRVRPDFQPDAGDAAALASICRRLDGIPLALELAAARTATIAPVPLAHRLSERLSMVAGSSRDVMPRQRTLEASVAWSYQLLDLAEQRAFRRLSVFPAPFPLDAATAIVDAGDPATGERLVLRLIDCSLLAERTIDDQPAAHMLETVRWFARERLAETGETDDASSRHLDWFLTQARALGAELETRTVRTALDGLERHLDNLRAAMSWALDHDRPLDAARMISAAPSYWVWRGRIDEALRWLDRARDAIAHLQPADELDLGWARAHLVAHAATTPGLRTERSQPLLDLARELGDERIEARLLVGRSAGFAFVDPTRAEKEADAGRALSRKHHDRYGEGIGLYAAALARITTGRFDLAEAALDELRPLARSLGHPQLIADEMARRVMVDRRYGRYDAVMRAATEIDVVTEGLTDFNSQALVHAAAAFVDVAQGRADRALAAMESLYQRYEIAGERQYRPSLALPMMEALIDLGRPDEAIERFAELWDTCRQIVAWRLNMGPTRGAAHICAGNPHEARTVLEDSLDAAHNTGNAYAAAVANRFLAAIDRDEGAYQSAEQRLHQALETHAAGGYPQPVADILEELAGIELDHGRPSPAATFFGAASAIRDRGGVTRRVGRQGAYDTDLATLHEQLNTDELAANWAQGASLELRDAVELANRGRGERRRPTTGWESLTATEMKVAELVAQGHTNPQIADQLIMGRATVKTHVSNILRKLSLENRTQLAGLHARRERP